MATASEATRAARAPDGLAGYPGVRAQLLPQTVPLM